MDELKRKNIRTGTIFIAGTLTALTVIFGSWYTVDQTERGVILRNGAIIGTAQPGLGFKVPVIDSVVDFSIQTHLERFDKLVAYSADQQPATMAISVNYRLAPDKVTEIYTQYGSAKGAVDRVIRPHVLQKAKVVFGSFTAVKAIQERARLNSEIALAIQESVDGPVIIESIQIENIDFSDAYEASVEQRMLAEVEVQQLKQNAEREKVQAQITVTKATAEADAIRARAVAEAEAIKLRGGAEATAIKARGNALRENPNLIGLVQAEKWNGVLPTTMIPGGALPMINIVPSNKIGDNQ